MFSMHSGFPDDLISDVAWICVKLENILIYNRLYVFSMYTCMSCHLSNTILLCVICEYTLIVCIALISVFYARGVSR